MSEAGLFRTLESAPLGASATIAAALDQLRYDAQGLVPAIAQDAASGAVLMLAFTRAVAMRVQMGVRMLVRVGVHVRMRMEQVAVPVPVLVLVRMLVRVLMQVVVRVASGAGGLVVRHEGLREGSRRRKLTEPARGRQAVLTPRDKRVTAASAGGARERATGRCRASARR